MSKGWYPVIDYSKCNGCMACRNMCKNGVYSVKNRRPVVVNPVGCVHGCHGCGNKCPVKAIRYYGDVENE